MDLSNINKLKLNNHELDYVTECDYLGIRIDFKLSFEKFYKKVKQSSNHKLYMLGRIRKYLNTTAAVTILKSMVLPFLEYGGLFLEACDERFQDKLHRIFCRGIRLALNNYSNHINEFELHQAINFLPLTYRRGLMIAKHMFKEKEKSNVNLVIRSGMSTRLHDGPVMLVPDATNDKFKRFLPWLGPSVWNSLPSDVRNQSSYSGFVRDLKTH